MPKKDYYEVLGIQKNASKDELKKAFHKKAHQYHPDKNKGADAQFKEVNEAYQTLSDDQKRAAYDQFGHAGANMGGGGPGGFGGFGGGQGFGGFDFSGAQQGFDMGDLGDIFSDFFNGGRGAQQQPARGRDISTEIQISFEEAVFGITKNIVLTRQATCDTCSGNGAKKGATMKKCDICNGKGRVHETRRSFLGTFSTEKICDACAGTGQIPSEYCGTCKGKGVYRKEEEIKIKVPAGIENGEMVRLRGIGEAIRGAQTGDLYVKIHVRAHKSFTRDGNTLLTNISVKLSDALLGMDYPLETLDGTITLKVPAGINHGELLRVREKGVPNERGRRGDLLVKISVITPTKLSKHAKELVEELKKEGI